MAERAPQEDRYVKGIYRRIIALALAAHVSYIVIFGVLGLWGLSAYNLGSALFYCAMLLAVQRGCYRTAVTCIHLEVCLFVTVCTLSAGWEIGLGLYLVALTSLTYFCPYEHKSIPYLFAGLEIGIFLALKLYTRLTCPGFLGVPEAAGHWLYVYSACACFTVILYAAFSSKVSAAVGRQELQKENRSLSALANYDQLTGLLNRHAFLARAEKEQGGVTLALGDIDDFKRVNDTWGHTCGDRVLSETAELIRRRLGSEADICRWGGEEFVILFRALPQETVQKRVQELCDEVAGHTFHYCGAELKVTMTFGISPDAGRLTAEELIAMADRQMYEGKAGGKNRVVCGRGADA